jgi:Transcriptional regulator
LLNTLKDYDMIEQTEKMYSLGKAFLKYEGIVLNSMEIRRICLPFLDELASTTRGNANLAILDGNEVLYIARSETSYNSFGCFNVGMRRPIYCNSLGKVLISNKLDQIKDIFKNGVRRFTMKTITNEAVFIEEIEKVRLQGYATDFEEWGNGINCIGAPLYDSSEQLVAAIGISGPTTVFDQDTIMKYVPVLIECANRISGRLGATR